MLFFSSAGVQYFRRDNVRCRDRLYAALGARCDWSLCRKEMVFDSGNIKKLLHVLVLPVYVFFVQFAFNLRRTDCIR